MNPWWIYTLLDPRTQQVRYVGATTNIKRRLARAKMAAAWAKRKETRTSFPEMGRPGPKSPETRARMVAAQAKRRRFA